MSGETTKNRLHRNYQYNRQFMFLLSPRKLRLRLLHAINKKQKNILAKNRPHSVLHHRLTIIFRHYCRLLCRAALLTTT